MSWEQRLREMVLAGGALATTACGGSTAAQADAASASPNLGGDATALGDNGDGGAAGDDAGPPFCCSNIVRDPCTEACSGVEAADAAACTSCEQAEAACGAMNGVLVTQPDGSLHCTAFGPPVDAGAGPRDAAPIDDTGPADADPADVQFHFPCCNANPDPCCPIAYCSGGVGPDASIYVSCEQNRTQCESTNGYYETQPDGSLGCTPTSTTGH